MNRNADIDPDGSDAADPIPPHATAYAAEGGRAASRDFLENPTFQFFHSALLPPPRPDSPDLVDCPHCGRPWVSRLAMFCPTCAYSFQMARAEAKKEWRFRIEISMLFPVVVAIAVATRSDDLSTDLAIAQATINQMLIIASAIQGSVVAWVWWRWARRTKSNASARSRER